MPGKQDSEKVEGFALEPIGSRKHLDEARHRSRLVRLDFEPDALVHVRTKQVVDDVEPLLALRVVGAADVDEGNEAARGIIAQEARGPHDLANLQVYREFA